MDIKNMDFHAKLHLVMVDCKFPSGRKKMTEVDLGLNEEIPKDLASIGSKQLIPKALIAPLGGIRSSVNRKLQEYGVKFYNGFIIKDEDLNDVHNILLEFKDDFDNALHNIKLKYTTDCAIYHSEIEDRGFDNIISKDELIDCSDFVKACSYKFTSVVVSDAGMSQDKIDDVESTVSANIIDELITTATRIRETRFSDRQRACSESSFNSLLKIKDKLDSFSVTDSRLTIISELFKPMMNESDIEEKTNKALDLLDTLCSRGEIDKIINSTSKSSQDLFIL